MSDFKMPAFPDPVPGPYSHQLVEPGTYNILHRGKPFGMLMLSNSLKMEGVLVRDVVDGFNTGWQRRHADDEVRGAGDAGGREAPGVGDQGDPTRPASVSTSPAPDVPQGSLVAAAGCASYDDVPAVREWLTGHPRRDRSTGVDLAMRAYFDEIADRPDIDRDGTAAA